MPYKDEKVIGILLEQAAVAEARCDGYHEELAEAVADIMTEERQNRFARTNIAVRVADIVSRVGTYLYTHSSGGKG
ncbi:hypothetical protein [Sphingobium sp. YR768]|uniref:hypothetical protein n=1 Tax=Sphingobium sp. YR768 TaxID=1884365 RepID=UPI0008CA3785|nr:hypothetical protein [Sphingobium sp. YR768]SEQ99887.1 hypothetical protein SAMN05518866_10454 [Sphingobium sp. YR768]